MDDGLARLAPRGFADRTTVSRRASRRARPPVGLLDLHGAGHRQKQPQAARRLARRVALPISADLLASGPRHVEALTAYRDGDPDPILQVFADSAVRSAAEGRRLGHEVHGIHAGWSEILAALDEFAARAGRRVPLR